MLRPFTSECRLRIDSATRASKSTTVVRISARPIREKASRSLMSWRICFAASEIRLKKLPFLVQFLTHQLAQYGGIAAMWRSGARRSCETEEEKPPIPRWPPSVFLFAISSSAVRCWTRASSSRFSLRISSCADLHTIQCALQLRILFRQLAHQCFAVLLEHISLALLRNLPRPNLACPQRCIV